MSSPSSRDLEYTQFILRLPTLRYQHAVVLCGQKLLHLILKTLICGNIHNISGCVKRTLKSNSQYKSSFTKDEQQHLEEGDAKKWDISLLFKVIQKVCGLEPISDNCWTQSTGGDECLEYLVTTLKELRNELVHKFDIVITADQLEDRLDELTTLALNIIAALGARSLKLRKQLSEEEATKTNNVVLHIIEDAKGKIKSPTGSLSGSVLESVDSEDDSDEEDEYDPDELMYDSVFQAAGVEQIPQSPSLEAVFKNLRRKFWKYAGPEEDEI